MARFARLRCTAPQAFAALILQVGALSGGLLAQTATTEPFEECSVGVAAGRATADGRPLLWKNRDSQNLDNVLRSFDDGRFAYVGLCNAGSGRSVWGGVNAAGFCIMNSVSRDLGGNSRKGPSNGPFMKLALQRCANVEEFEELLAETNDGGRRTRANFGVIDADGGAAIFETGHATYVRFDADDAEQGIVVRTNFATTAGGDRGRERFARATELCFERPRDAVFDHRYLLQTFCRDLQAPPGAIEGASGLRDVRETIHRQTTVSSMVFHGVREGENPQLATMWTILGQPLFAVAVPAWPTVELAPECAGSPRAPLCDVALQLKSAFYVHDPDAAVAGDAELSGDVRWLRSEPALEAVSQTLEAENEILRGTSTALEALRADESAKASDLTTTLTRLHRQQAQRAYRCLDEMVEQRSERVRVRLTGTLEDLEDGALPASLHVAGETLSIERSSFSVWVPNRPHWQLRFEIPGHRPLVQTKRSADVRHGVLELGAVQPTPREDRVPALLR